jgi:hypothetical protein
LDGGVCVHRLDLLLRWIVLASTCPNCRIPQLRANQRPKTKAGRIIRTHCAALSPLVNRGSAASGIVAAAPHQSCGCRGSTPRSRRGNEGGGGGPNAWLIEAVTGTRFYIPVIYDPCTGLRRGEILAQRWQDVDFEGETLVVAQSLEQTRKGGLKFEIPKNKKRRRIAMPPLLIEALKRHGEEQEKNRRLFGSDYKADLDLIVALPDGSPWKPDSFTAACARFATKIGLKGVRFHGLRHSHASHLLRQRVPLKTVHQRLGHANASTTLNTYAHMLPGDDSRGSGVD